MPLAPDEPPVVHIVDDDDPLRQGLASLLRSIGLNARTYGSTQGFLQADCLVSAGCIVLDIRLPGMSGLDFQEQLAQLGIRLPVILMTGHGDIPMTVRAMKAGAVDFLPKPFRVQDMIDAVTVASAARERRPVPRHCRSVRNAFSARARGHGIGDSGQAEQAGCGRTGTERGDGQNPSRFRDAKDGGPISRRSGSHGRCAEGSEIAMKGTFWNLGRRFVASESYNVAKQEWKDTWRGA